MNKILSQTEWAERAKAVLPAGGFGNFDSRYFIREGKGSRVWDEDGKEYVDLLIGSGPMILGHGHPEVLEVVLEQVQKGMTFFANNAAGVELAEEICRAVACAEKVRYVSTGSEADMYAMRLARAFTGREKILKFEGGYHGMSSEAQMSLAPARLVNFPQAVPDSAGIPEGVRADMLIAPYNDPDYLESLCAEHGSEIAAIIIEPLQRIVPAEPGFLEAVRKICDAHGIVLIFDEVVTGFRFGYGGAQERYGVTPDLTTLGKVIGGGFPLAAIAGRADIMALFEKGGDRWLMQVGTLSGNPVAAVAGLKTMEVLRRDGQYDRLNANGARLMEMASQSLTARGVPHRAAGAPEMFEIIFTDRDIRNYRDVMQADAGKLSTYNEVLREKGLFKSDGKTYISLALTEADMDLAKAAYEAAADAVAG
ncbi:aspartate aminotransferase family protein [Hwanghaeella sp.]|uniref:aspartate aminotransferase family protein n=1 Tax=Hwanghaeella sp. TaxID=2605943 RepID=UPI003CCC3A46